MSNPAQESQIPCNYCGNPLPLSTARLLRGRPQQMCSDKCRRAAKYDKNRICVQCHKQFNFATSPLMSSRFCSSECQQAFETNPANPQRTKVNLEDARFLKALEDQSGPITDPPVPRRWRPWRNLTPEILPAERMSPKLANSIGFWNHLLPLTREHFRSFDKLDVAVAISGIRGWGGAHTPRGCLTLVQCWPWIQPQFKQEVFDVTFVLRCWEVYGIRSQGRDMQTLNKRRTAILTKIAQNAEDPKRHRALFDPERGSAGIPLVYYEIKNINRSALDLDPKDWIPYPYHDTLRAVNRWAVDTNLMYVETVQGRKTPPWAVMPYTAEDTAVQDLLDRWAAVTEPIITRYRRHDVFK